MTGSKVSDIRKKLGIELMPRGSKHGSPQSINRLDKLTVYRIGKSFVDAVGDTERAKQALAAIAGLNMVYDAAEAVDEWLTIKENIGDAADQFISAMPDDDDFLPPITAK